MGRRALFTAVVLLASLGPAVTSAGAAARHRPVKKAHLSAFGSCDALLSYARLQAVRTGGDTGVPFRGGPGTPVTLTPQPAVAKDVAGAPQPTAAPVAAAPGTQSGEAFSGTNDQEAGVDEPDVVKTDGKRMFVIAGGSLLAIDVTGPQPRQVGSLALEGSGQEMLLRGDRVLVIGSPSYSASSGGDVAVGAPAAGVAPQPLLAMPYRAETQLTEVDVHDPSAMTISRTLTVAGSYASARLTGGTARVVLDTPPGIVASPTTTATTARAAARPGLSAFVPKTVIRSRISGRTFTRPLVGCTQVRRPDTFSGLDLLTVLTIDLDRGLFSVDRDAVMAGAQVVYASDKSLYVASQRYVPGLDTAAEVPPRMQTEIHRFDTSDPGRTTYASSGRVSGFVLNQYALSEYGGVLRVASTEDPLWLNGAQQQDSSSAVTVLREQGSQLVQVGRVGGLGASERIFAVRFIGDAGYLVTFRQVDPLYTLDLSKPEAPRVAGELKITGYSAYLHPIADGLLLGVGQDASAEGRRAGAQVSVFDVSDPAQPRRLHHRSLGDSGSSTAADFDPHAFLWWPKENTAVLPLEDYSGATPFAGAVGLRIRRTQGIEEIGRVSHGNDPYPAAIQRAVVVGDRLYTLSDRGVAASRLATFEQTGFLAFPLPTVTTPIPPVPGPVPVVTAIP